MVPLRHDNEQNWHTRPENNTTRENLRRWTSERERSSGPFQLIWEVDCTHHYLPHVVTLLGSVWASGLSGTFYSHSFLPLLQERWRKASGIEN
jgi:hypothetical protein